MPAVSFDQPRSSADSPRRSTSSNNGERRFSSTGMFQGLQDYKRHPENERINARRISQSEQNQSKSGFLGNMFNKAVGRHN